MKLPLAIAGLVVALSPIGNQVVWAQADDDTIQYSHGLPITGEDTLSQAVDSIDREPKDIEIRLEPDQLPTALRRTLKRGEQYKGWERSAIFIQKNTGLYVVRITEGATTRIYRFNRNGKAVSYDEESGNVN